MYEALVEYKQKLKEDPSTRIPEYVGECIYLICEKLSTRYNFGSYSFRDDMVGDGIENCVAAVASFDPEKSNLPFAYFTRVAWRAFVRKIQKEKKQSYIKHKNFRENVSGMLSEEDVNVYVKTSDTYSVEKSNELIATFEEKQNLQKLTKAKKEVKTGVERFVEADQEKE